MVRINSCWSFKMISSFSSISSIRSYHGSKLLVGLSSKSASGLRSTYNMHCVMFQRPFSVQSMNFNQNKPSQTPENSTSTKRKLPSIESSKKAVETAKQIFKNITPHENVYTLPNMLTVSRLISAPFIGYLIVQGHSHWALGIFIYSCITDFLDGLIARRYNMRSVVGSVIDPLADKTLMIILTSCLSVSGEIPIYIAALILGRDALLGISAFYYRYISLPPPKTFLRFFDFSIPSAEVHPTQISKLNTLLQMVYLGCSLMVPTLQTALDSETLHTFVKSLQLLEYTVATTTVLSGLSYVFSKNAVKILNPGTPKSL